MIKNNYKIKIIKLLLLFSDVKERIAEVTKEVFSHPDIRYD